MEAACREEVFVALRERGIRAIKVVAADGSRANGEVRGVRKRMVALLLAVVAAVVGAVAYFGGARSGTAAGEGGRAAFDSPVRRQVIGDSAVIEKGVRTGWAEVFPLEGERFLASFAIPGVPAGLRSVAEAEVREALARKVAADGGDAIEARQIKAIVEGMKRELREFLAQGGTVAAYGRKLVARQEEEIGYYTRAVAEIEAARKSGMPAMQLEELWERRNASLRQMGIKLVPMPA